MNRRIISSKNANSVNDTYVTNSLLKICPDFFDWPKRWMAVQKDIAYGENIVAILKPFIEDLILKGYSKKTIQKHITNLWLFGGELIRMLDMDEDLRNKEAIALVMDNVGLDGGPYCRHLDTEEDFKSYDSTCRKLFKFLKLTHRDT